MAKSRVLLAVLLGIAAVAAIALGVMYVVVPVHSLPSFIPGHAAVGLAKHKRRGEAGIGVGTAEEQQRFDDLPELDAARQ